MLLGFLCLLKSLVPWPHHPGPPRLAKRTEMRKGKQMVVLQPLAVICSRFFWDLFRLYIYIITDYYIYTYILSTVDVVFLKGFFASSKERLMLEKHKANRLTLTISHYGSLLLLEKI